MRTVPRAKTGSALTLLPTSIPGVRAGWGDCADILLDGRNVELRVHIMSTAGAGKAGQYGSGSPSTWVADEQRVLAVQHDTLHFSLTEVVVDGHGAIGAERVQLRPLPQTHICALAVLPALSMGMMVPAATTCETRTRSAISS